LQHGGFPQSIRDVTVITEEILCERERRPQVMLESRHLHFCHHSRILLCRMISSLYISKAFKIGLDLVLRRWEMD